MEAILKWISVARRSTKPPTFDNVLQEQVLKLLVEDPVAQCRLAWKPSKIPLRLQGHGQGDQLFLKWVKRDCVSFLFGVILKNAAPT